MWNICVFVLLCLGIVSVVKGNTVMAALLMAPLMYIVKCCYYWEKIERLLELYACIKDPKERESIEKDILTSILADMEEKSPTILVIYLFPFHRDNKK